MFLSPSLPDAQKVQAGPGGTTPWRSLLPTSHGPCWGTWGYQRPQGSKHVSVPPKELQGPAHTIHSPARLLHTHRMRLSYYSKEPESPVPGLPFCTASQPRVASRGHLLAQASQASPDSAAGQGPAATRPGASLLSSTPSRSKLSLGSSPALPFRPAAPASCPGGWVTPSMGPSWPCDSPHGLAGATRLLLGSLEAFLKWARGGSQAPSPISHPHSPVPSDGSGLPHNPGLLLSPGAKLHGKGGRG